MAPTITRIGTAGFGPVASPPGPSPRSTQAERSATPSPEAGVTVATSLEILETMAGQVADSTGEPCPAASATAPEDVDPGYRVELMSFIAGALSRAAQALRLAPEPPPPPEEEEEPALPLEMKGAAAPPEEEGDAEEPSEPALPGGAEPEPETTAAQGTPGERAPAYDREGHALPEQEPPAKVERWA